MIAKAIKGRGFRGTLNYDLEKEEGYLLDTNMSADNPKELAAEFGEIRRLRPTLGKAVLHVSLSAAPGEHLTDEQWCDIGRSYLEGMGFTNNQYVMTRHLDTDHEHIHIIANRIQFNGEVTTDSHDYRRQEVLMRQIEKDYDLEKVAPSLEVERKAPTKGEIEHALRTNEPSTRQQLQQLCDVAAKDCPNMSQYVERLQDMGVQLVSQLQLEGEKLSGLSYRLDEVTMKGSDLGKGYTPSGLNKRGITYEKDRDFETVSRARERAENRTLNAADRSLESEQTPERGGISRNPGAISPGDGRTHRRDEEDLERDSSREHEAGEGVQELDGQHDELLENSRPGIAERSPEPSRRRETTDLVSLRSRDDDRNSFGSARDRIIDLATPATEGRGGYPGFSPGTERGHDRTSQAIERQIEALGGDQFDIVLIDKNKNEIKKTWSKAEIEKNTPWLKRMNARGHDIGIKPHGEHGLVLVVGLEAEKLEQLRKVGFNPAVTVEKSPGEYEAWVKFSDKAVNPKILEVITANLARNYGNQQVQEYGRLAGFTNQDPETHRDGLQPYVLSKEATGKVAEKGRDVVKGIEDIIEREMLKGVVQERIEKIGQPLEWWKPDHERVYKLLANEWIREHGGPDRERKHDFKEMDLEVCMDMARAGRFSQEDIEQALYEFSPNLETREVKKIKEYAKEMAVEVFSMEDVMEEHEWNRELDRERSRSRGLER